ncbi:MAG TPA: exodeoxyribonuclease VII small subunit [Actinobacteria bacterium]|nr:exodeoxyribonuclease VII small subunit [Actinomycetota bacterium]
MADEKYTFETARVRLEEIAAEARKKDTSLEKSLDLLEEGVRLANICTELVDHTDMSAAPAPGSGEVDGVGGSDDASGAGDVVVPDIEGTAAEDDVPGQPLNGADPDEGVDATGDAQQADASAE